MSHQHWIDQVLANGGFNVGCTQGAEASHKTHMRLPSKRVQHRRDNVTTSNMQEYLCLHSLFEKLFRDFVFQQYNNTNQQQRKPPALGVQSPLHITMDVDMRPTANQRQFLHSQVRLTRAELLDLLCMKLQVPPTLVTYNSMSDLRWTFVGTKLYVENEISYTIAPSPSCESEKSNVFLLKGYEPVY